MGKGVGDGTETPTRGERQNGVQKGRKRRCRPSDKQLADNVEGSKEGKSQLESCAGEETKEGTPGGTQCRTALLAADKLADQRTRKRPKDDSQQALRAERKPDDGNDKSYVAAPNSRFAASVALGAPRGHNVVEKRDDNGHCRCGYEERGGELRRIAEMDQQQRRPAERRAGKSGNYGTGYADKEQDYCQDYKYGGHRD